MAYAWGQEKLQVEVRADVGKIGSLSSQKCITFFK